jgi:hypothetical protein
MYMFISQEREISPLRPFEKPKIKIVSWAFHGSFYDPWPIYVQRHFPLISTNKSVGEYHNISWEPWFVALVTSLSTLSMVRCIDRDVMKKGVNEREYMVRLIEKGWNIVKDIKSLDHNSLNKFTWDIENYVVCK